MSRLRTTSYSGDPSVKPPYGSVEVDQAHSLRNGLITAFLFNETAGPPINLVAAPPITRVGDPPWISNIGGPAISFNGSSQILTFPNLFAGNADYSVAAWLRIISATNFGMISAPNSSGGGNELRQQSTTLQMSFTAGNDGASCVDDTAVTLGIWYFFVATWDNATAAMRLYRDGVLVKSLSGGAGQAFTNVHALAGRSNSTFFSNCDIREVLWWKRVVLASEISELAAEPYVFLRPIIRRRYFVPPQAAAEPSANIFIPDHIGRGIGRGVFVGR